MELNNEIKKLFDKFEGGSLRYEKNGNHIEIKDFYNYFYIHACFNDDYATIALEKNGEIDYHYASHKNNEGFDSGSAIFVNERTQNNIQNVVLNAKHYLEENGYDEDLFEKNVAEDISFWIRNKRGSSEEKVTRNLSNMKRIVDKLNDGLYWID